MAEGLPRRVFAGWRGLGVFWVLVLLLLGGGALWLDQLGPPEPHETVAEAPAIPDAPVTPPAMAEPATPPAPAPSRACVPMAKAMAPLGSPQCSIITTLCVRSILLRSPGSSPLRG